MQAKRLATKKEYEKAKEWLKNHRRDPSFVFGRTKLYCRMIVMSFEMHIKISEAYFSVL